MKAAKSKTGSLLYTRNQVRKLLAEKDEALGKKEQQLQQAIAVIRTIVAHLTGVAGPVHGWLDEHHPMPAKPDGPGVGGETSPAPQGV